MKEKIAILSVFVNLILAVGKVIVGALKNQLIKNTPMDIINLKLLQDY